MATAKKRKVITITGMGTLFGVSRMTVYNKYIPKLEKLPSVNNRVLFDYNEAKKLHDSFQDANNYEVIA